MYLASALTVFLRVDALFIGTLKGESVEPFFLKDNRNPLMIPFLESAGGNCQDAVTLVEVFAVRDKLVGAFEGTANDKCNILH